MTLFFSFRKITQNAIVSIDDVRIQEIGYDMNRLTIVRFSGKMKKIQTSRNTTEPIM